MPFRSRCSPGFPQPVHAIALALILAATVICRAEQAPGATTEEGSWRFGVASVDITPTEALPMAGYGGRDHAATERIAPLYAKVLVLEDASGSRVVLVTADLIGIDRTLGLSLRTKIAERAATDREGVVIACSHTHTGPVVGRNLEAMHYRRLDEELQQRVDRYAERLERMILEAADRAIASLEPGSLAFDVGSATFAVNRRNNVEAEVPHRRTTGRLVGPVDHRVPVLAIRDERSALRAVIFGYACHATVLASNEWSGDWPGFAQQGIEGRFPGATAFFWAGCGADQNPLPRRDVALAKHYGEAIAVAVESVLRTRAMRTLAPQLAGAGDDISLTLVPETDVDGWRSRLEANDSFERGRAATILARLDPQGNVPSDYPYPIVVWRLGDPASADRVDWVFLGGEVTIDYALRLAPPSEASGDRSSEPQRWIAAYANDVMAYIPSRRVLQEGGYEGGGAMTYYGLPGPWHESIEERVVEAVESRLTR